MKAGIYLDPVGNLIYVAKDRTIKAMSCDDFGARKVGAKVSHRAKDDTVQIEGTDYRCTRHADVPNGCTDHKSLVDSMQMVAGLKPGERVVDYGTKFARVEEIDNPADVARAITENCAKALGVEVDHESFDKAAEELSKPATDDEFDRIKAEADDPYKRFAQGGFVTGRMLRDDEVPAVLSERRYFIVPPELTMPYTERELEAWRKKFADTLRKQGFRIVHKVSARKHRKRGHTVIPLHGGWYAWRPADYLYPYQRDALARFVSDERITIKVPVNIGKSEAGVL